MSAVARRAPAKINLTLEVVARRPDGYHELRSIAVTCDLCDELEVASGSGLVVTAAEGFDATGMPDGRNGENTIETALALIVQERARTRGEQPMGRAESLRLGLSQVSLRLQKRIPAAAGLGGGTSDGAAALLALDEFWGLGLGSDRLRELAAMIGSDCPFFIEGGLQLMSGRGEILRPIAGLPQGSLALCVVRPPVFLPGKTARLYALLQPEHFSDGRRSDRLAVQLVRGVPPGPNELFNVFDQVADVAYGGLVALNAALVECGARAVHLCGAGPTVYGLFASPAGAVAACTALAGEGFEAWAVAAPAL